MKKNLIEKRLQNRSEKKFDQMIEHLRTLMAGFIKQFPEAENQHGGHYDLIDPLVNVLRERKDLIIERFTANEFAILEKRLESLAYILEESE